MATDFISREAAIGKITALINKSGKYTAYESGADDACYIVEHEIPTADVRPVVHGEPIYRKPKTHRDELHTMTNEELAALLANEACPTKESIRCKEFFNYCDSCWLDWLKQEVNNG